ncbi:MAG: MFS transporter [Sphingomonas sp.]
MSDRSRSPDDWESYVATLKPHERPTLAGSPATPDHPLRVRLAYAAVGTLVTLTGGLGAAVILANQQSLAGSYGVTQAEAAWAPVLFVMTNATANLLLVRFRQQFGLRLFSEIILVAFVAVTLGHLLAPDFETLLVARAIAGICATGLSTLGILYMMQVFPPAHRIKGLILAVGLAGISAPAARLYSPGLIEFHGWQGVHWLELGLALLSLAAVFALRLPLSERFKVFQPLDFLTVALFAPGIGLLCAVLGLGRVLWWTEAAWIGWALIGAIVLLSASFLIEHGRKRPLIDLRWVTTGDIARMVFAILVVRIVLSEQVTGAVGFLQTMGVGPDQLYGLFAIVLVASAAGTLASALTVNLQRLYLPIAIALAMVAVGAAIDSQASVLTRPENLYLSQALLAFAAALFIGPTLLLGFGPLIARGARHMVSFIVAFSTMQNLASLAGSALVGSVETIRAREHATHLAESIGAGDPMVVQRLQQLGGAYAHTIGDPALRQASGFALLQQQVAQQAAALAYNDIFQMIAVIAAIGAVWMAFEHLRRRPAPAAAKPTD